MTSMVCATAISALKEADDFMKSKSPITEGEQKAANLRVRLLARISAVEPAPAAQVFRAG